MISIIKLEGFNLLHIGCLAQYPSPQRYIGIKLLSFFSIDAVNIGASMESLSTCSSVVRSSRMSEGGDSGICLTPHEPNCGLMSPFSAPAMSPNSALGKSGIHYVLIHKVHTSCNNKPCCHNDCKTAQICNSGVKVPCGFTLFLSSQSYQAPNECILTFVYNENKYLHVIIYYVISNFYIQIRYSYIF